MAETKEEVKKPEVNKIEFEVESLKLCVRRPNFKQRKQGEMVYVKAFKDALKAGAILKSSLADYMKEQGIVTIEKQQELLSLLNKIDENAKKLENPELDPKEGSNIASELIIDRITLEGKLSEQWVINQNCAESLAENERFNYYVSVCTYKEDGKPYFNSLDHYYEEADNTIGQTCASKLSSLLHDLDENYRENLPENKYLEKIKKNPE